jgi:(S)-ureidoglycine aminohydrolase
VQGLGSTRSRLTDTHLLQTADTFVRNCLPGMSRASAVVHASPEIGAKFVQYTAEFEAQGTLGRTGVQRFVYVLDGQISIETQSVRHSLAPGGFAYIPEGVPHQIAAPTPSRAAIIEKPYQESAAIPHPELLVSREDEVLPSPLMGDEGLLVRSLLPNTPSFDFAVNTMEYKPGAALSMVEVHVMEHGLLMLEGGGIYRLGDSWYPVTAGDFIWMSPYCPQWFGALGKKPAKYLIYKDWNRSY